MRANIINILYSSLIVAAFIPDPSLPAAEPAETMKYSYLFSSLPFPDSDPLKWRWSQPDSEKAIQILGQKGELLRHSPKEASNSALNDKAPAGDSPPAGRGHGGMTYVNWTFGLNKLADLSMDITFHEDPQPLAAVYVQLYDFKIGDTLQYFGFQYSFDEKNQLYTSFIWSRWNTRDKANAAAVEGGEIISSGHEGDFVSVRYPYRFKKGTYTVHVMMRETDAAGTWYEMGIYDHQKKQWAKIGRLRFPTTGSGLPFISDGGGSWCEVFGGTKSSSDIGLMHLSYDGAYTCGRTVTANEVCTSYGKDTPNSDISPDQDFRGVHVRFGGETRRATPAGRYKLKD